MYTKLRRRFVHNPETGESLWKFPQDIMMAVIDMDHKEREERARVERGEATAENEEEAPSLVPKQGKSPPTGAAEKQPIEAANKDVKDYDSDEYEEVEVTDDEDADKARKRQKLEQEEPARPVEFNEEDIAFQLAAMGHEPDDPAGGEEWGEDYEEELLNEEDANALFVDLLEDFHINPFTPWETIVEEGKIIEDDRYTCLPNMKARKDVWTDWSRNKMHAIREQRQQQEKRDPRIPYMALLQKHATPKLYWSEFKRKFRKEPEMRDTKLVDRDREKWYREYISRKLCTAPESIYPANVNEGLKLPETTLKSDLTALLKAQPLTALNRSTSLEALPSALLVDLRYVSVPARVRDPLVEAYIAIQPSAPADAGADAEAAAEETRRRAERERRENALEERERRVKEEKRRNRASLEQGRERLREEEEEVERAMKVGRDGLRGHVQGEG